jgi:hypothetical protein
MERVALEVDASTVTAEGLGLPLPVPGVGAETEGDAEEHTSERLLEALRRTKWNISRTATLLGVTRKTVRARIQRFGLRLPGEVVESTPANTLSAAAALPSPVVTTAEFPVGSPPMSSVASSAEPVTPTLPAAPEPLPSAPPGAVRWERRRVTLLRARIISDSAVPFAAATRVLEGLVERVRSFGGRVEDLSARGLVGVFGLEPDQDAPRRAAHSGLAT